MSRWFRFYSESIHDPKLLRLSDATYRAWTILLCIASDNGGVLPSAADIALTLRIKQSVVATWIAELVAGNLLDKTESGLVPHNWDGRQYKSDVTDHTNAQRQKRYRNARRNGSNVVTDKRPDTEADTEADTEQKEDRIGEALASEFTAGSKALADAFWRAVGITDKLQIPPNLAGADWKALQWERAGWTVDLIEAEARRIGPDKPLSYHEKVFATAFAKRQAPLPVVEIREAEKLTVTHGITQNRRGNSLLDALDRRIAEAEIEEKSNLALPEGAVLGLPNRSIC